MRHAFFHDIALCAMKPLKSRSAIRTSRVWFDIPVHIDSNGRHEMVGDSACPACQLAWLWLKANHKDLLSVAGHSAMVNFYSLRLDADPYQLIADLAALFTETQTEQERAP